MARILYRIADGFGEAREICRDGRETLELKIENRTDGVITIGKITKKLGNGKVIFKLSELDNGEYAPLLTAEAPINLEPFLKHTSGVTLGRTDDKIIRRLLERMEIAEEKIAALEQALGRLTDEITNKTIF